MDKLFVHPGSVLSIWTEQSGCIVTMGMDKLFVLTKYLEHSQDGQSGCIVTNRMDKLFVHPGSVLSIWTKQSGSTVCPSWFCSKYFKTGWTYSSSTLLTSWNFIFEGWSNNSSMLWQWLHLSFVTFGYRKVDQASSTRHYMDKTNLDNTTGHLHCKWCCDVLSMFVLSKWQRVALPMHWRASVRAHFYWFGLEAPNNVSNCYLDKINMDKTSQHLANTAEIFQLTNTVYKYLCRILACQPKESKKFLNIFSQLTLIQKPPIFPYSIL